MRYYVEWQIEPDEIKFPTKRISSSKLINPISKGFFTRYAYINADSREKVREIFQEYKIITLDQTW